MITKRADDLRRLNAILKLTGAGLDVAALNDTRWNALLDDLYFAVLGEKGRVFRQDMFHWATTRAGVRVAQEGLRMQLPVLQRHKREDPAPEFMLSAQRVYVAAGKDGFASKYLCDDCPTMVYSTLAYLLERSRVTQRDILTCANERCGAFFVPLRKPHRRHKRGFCSQKCGSLIAARDYRKKKADELRAKERERDHKRYAEKIQKRLPGAKPARRPRKPK